MAIRSSKARWEGGLRGGKGTMSLGSGAWAGKYSFHTRFEEEPGTNPEELIAAALAGCFSMAFSAALERAEYPPESIDTTANATFAKIEAGWTITEIELVTEARVPGIEEAQFQEIAEGAKAGCPISRALSGSVHITLNATLLA